MRITEKESDLIKEQANEKQGRQIEMSDFVSEHLNTMANQYGLSPDMFLELVVTDHLISSIDRYEGWDEVACLNDQGLRCFDAMNQLASKYEELITFIHLVRPHRDHVVSHNGSEENPCSH